MTRDRPIRIGLLGLGLAAQAMHLPRLRARPDRFAIAHVCDLSSRLADAVADGLPGRPRVSTDPRALLDDLDLDAVLILTPGVHAAQALAALRAGKHVLAEKPLCITLAEAGALAAAAREAGRVLQVGYMKMHDPLIAPARAALPELGRAVRVRVDVLHPDHALQTARLHLLRFDDVDADAVNRARHEEAERVREALGDVPGELSRLYSGVLLGSVIHQLSVLRALGLGLPCEIEYAEATAGRPVPGLAHVLAVGRMANGVRVELAWNGLGAYPAYVEDTEILGDAGGLRLRLASPYAPGPPPSLRVYRNQDPGRVSDRHQAAGPDALTRQLIAFHEAVTSDGPVVADVAGVRADTACLQAIVAAIAAREGVTVGGEAALTRTGVVGAGVVGAGAAA